MRLRMHQRVHPRLPALVVLPHGTSRFTKYAGEVANLSVSGLCIQLPDHGPGALPPGSKARVFIERDDDLQPAGIDANLVNSDLAPDGRTQVHLKFERVRYDVIARITTQRRIIVELLPFGWTDYRQFLKSETG